jgi:hypothetical protein
MSEPILTFVLGGEVSLDEFSVSMQRFHLLVDALTEEVSRGENIKWIVDELSGGSAIATIRGEAESREAVDRVVKAYSLVGQALERHETIPYSSKVANAARTLTSVLNGTITSIRFETSTESATISTSAKTLSRAFQTAFGAIEGRIETLRSRHRLSFTLYDVLNDQAVHCSLRHDQADQVREAWGRRAIVEGWIKRDPATGRAIEVNPVEQISILPEVSAGSYRRARGIAPAPRKEPSVEIIIRQLRDA